ncbi:Poly(A) polymerase central domain-containing protein [Ilyonectria robusta]|uniref:Poly(A) polymerase central domain-containing protein n=1 Tax=Ilyonectria robusta TaxID=1079257 RepID=UPI001E8DA525|nr:Poly(A) polymerase central domain-containing protein [Ilyonectria robusta]KAH8686660.1 Poly(A) polymerase central domain-containing protein [Ilyonectria robusta]
MAGDQAFGVTPPISVILPTESEKRASDALIQELRNQKTFESPSDTDKRHAVLDSLQIICNEFVRRVALEKEPANEVLIRNARGKVFTYGSFRLGVFGPGSDIDTLIVAPKYVTRDDYFKHFPGLLVDMAPKGSITDLAVVTDAFVPIIKFEYSGISIDLIFSRIIQKQISPDFQDLKDSGLLRGLDEAELRSLNGTRVTDEILALVPEQSTFKLALRAIKLWAQRRAVYANIMGFPGGVAWAMLVARVCQLYPKAATSVIVNKFFLVMSQWRWPQPVLLKPIESGPLPVRVWNPKVYKGDSFHLMPVITPAYPSMCATFNITRSSMSIIKRELQRGLELSESVMIGKRPWSDLFVKHTFFTQGYKYYISVISASKTKEAHKIWSGYVESKVRMLVQKLEQHQSIALAHAFNKGYDRRHRCNSDSEIEQVQDGCLDFLVIENSEEAPDIDPKIENVKVKVEDDDNVKMDNIKMEEDVKVEEDVKMKTEEDAKVSETPSGTDVFTTTHYIGLELANNAKSLDLSYQVDEFKSLCTQWQKYQDDLKELVSIGVQHVRNFNLPDDVFDAGEKKPQKKSGGAKGAPNGKKRAPTEVLDSYPRPFPHDYDALPSPVYALRRLDKLMDEQENPPPAKRQQTSVAAAG